MGKNLSAGTRDSTEVEHVDARVDQVVGRGFSTRLDKLMIRSATTPKGIST
jgi:hypothetical protein